MTDPDCQTCGAPRGEHTKLGWREDHWFRPYEEPVGREAMRLLPPYVINRYHHQVREFDLGQGLSLRPCRIEVLDVSILPGAIRTVARLADRDSGENVEVTFNFHDECLNWLTGDERRQFIKQALLKMFSHELDELLLLHGQRKDPHVP